MSVEVILLTVGGYLSGSFPSGVILAKLFGTKDIRQEGSGNIGATNVYRVLGKGLGGLTLVGDVLKGVLPVILARALAGDELWIYTALCQIKNDRITPFWQVDFPLLNFRIPFWLMYKYHITGILYWESVYWDICQDPWQNPITWINKEYGYAYNGEGMLLYPGYDAGFFGFCSSLRLKTIRDGIEDYYYLYMADSLGILNDQINYVARDWNDWQKNADTLLLKRDKIARQIENKINR